MNNYTKVLLTIVFTLPNLLFSQNVEIVDGVPEDISTNKVIFLMHEAIELKTDEESEDARKYVLLRQENHNEVLKQYNMELKETAKSYLYEYTIAKKAELDSLKSLGYKYLLDSELFKYNHLKAQPEEDALIVFEFYLRDLETNKLYQVFELDEMKVYDAKLIVKRLNKAITNAQKSK